MTEIIFTVDNLMGIAYTVLPICIGFMAIMILIYRKID